MWATQFHPEKDIFEQGMQKSGVPFEHIAHSLEAVAMTQFFANWFVRHARANARRFAKVHDLWSRLLNNGMDAAPTWTIASPAFVQLYLFHDL